MQVVVLLSLTAMLAVVHPIGGTRRCAASEPIPRSKLMHRGSNRLR